MTTTNFQLRNADGQFVAPENIQLRGGDRTVQLTYEPLPVGDYSLQIDASEVTDRVGNALGEQDVVSEFTLIEGTIFWVGGSGDWNDPDNWDTGELPGPDDIVAISVPGETTITYSRGSTSVGAIFSQENLVISGGSLAVTGNSELNNGFTLSSGTLDADGNIIVGGNSSWTGGTIAGDAELINTGTFDWKGGTLTGNLANTGNFFEWTSGTINSDGGLTNTGTLNISGEGTKYLIGTFNNTGTIVHTSGTVRRYRGNAGTLNNSGTYRKSGEEAATVDVDFDLNDGTIDVQAGTLRLDDGGTSTGGSYSTAAGGVLDYSGGTHNFRGTYTVEGEGKVRINGATISNPEGETSNFNFTGTGNPIEWIAGFIRSDGGLTNAGTLKISGEGDKYLIGTFNNTGTIVHTSGTVRRYRGNAGTLNNSGTYRKSGEEAATVDVDFDLNDGTIDVQAGTLRLDDGGTSTGGSYSTAAGGVLDYSGGTHNFRGTYTVEGEGKVRINGATISNPEGETSNFNFTGTGNPIEWIAGFIRSDGGLTNAGTLKISGEGDKYLIGTFNNTGTIVHTSGTVRRYRGNAGTLNNSGTYRKSGEDTATVDVSFNNNGTAQVQQGTLWLTSGGTSSGAHTIAGNSVLEYNGGTHTLTGDYSVSGPGTVRLSGGTLDVSSDGGASFNPGNFDRTGGTFVES